MPTPPAAGKLRQHATSKVTSNHSQLCQDRCLGGCSLKWRYSVSSPLLRVGGGRGSRALVFTGDRVSVSEGENSSVDDG